MDEGGVSALLDKSRRQPNIKNRVEPFIEEVVIKMAFEFPAFGQVRASNELQKQGIFVSGGGIRSIWLRNNLQTRALRLNFIEKRVAEEGLILTEAQVVALENKKERDKHFGEIETDHPGYLGSQDTYYVGTLKGEFTKYINKPL